MASLFSTLATTAEHWNRPAPHYPTIANTLGDGAAVNRAGAAAALVNASHHSPAVVAFHLGNENHNICAIF